MSPVYSRIVPGELPRAPLSFQQENLWQLASAGVPCNIPPMTMRLLGSLDRRALDRALNEVVRRHAVLRTRFSQLPGFAPEQVVVPELAVDLAVNDVSGLPPADRQERATELLRDRSRSPLDLAVAPLMRVGLITMAPAEHLLWFVVNHLISDLWSMKLLLREVSQLYSAYAQGLESPLHPLPIQYTDYAVWQRAWLQGSVLDEQLACWRSQLDAAPSLQLPADVVPGSGTDQKGGVVSASIPGPLVSAISQLARRHGVTFFMTLLAAFDAFICRYGSSDAVVLDSLVAHRDRHEIEPLIGMFSGTVAVRTSVAGDPAFGELLARVRDGCLSVFQHHHLTFTKAISLMRQRSPEYVAVRPCVQFTLQRVPLDSSSFAGLSVEPFAPVGVTLFEASGVERPIWEQVWQVWEQPTGYEVVVIYQCERFTRERVRHMVDAFVALLGAIVTSPGQRLGQLRNLAACAPA
jgi:hypothetical protein